MFLRGGGGGGARKVSRSSSSLQGERKFAFIIDFIILFTLIMQEPSTASRKYKYVICFISTGKKSCCRKGPKILSHLSILRNALFD